MTAGSAYAIVLDGYNGNFGKYQIDITAEQVRPIHTIFGLPAYLFVHLSVGLAVCLAPPACLQLLYYAICACWPVIL